jgi:hypothetical protein
MPQQGAEAHDWKEHPKDWAEEQAHRVALEIRRLRGKRSAKWLADRTAELGSAVTRAVISDLEVGRRRYVTVSELVVLALALDTAPIALLYPAPYLEKIRALPTPEGNDPSEITTILAAQWFSGLASGVDADGSGQLMTMPLLNAMNMSSNLTALRRARSAQRIDESRLEKVAALARMRADKTVSSEETAELEAKIADLQKDIDELWALGGRDLDAERWEQLTGRRGGDSDGG